MALHENYRKGCDSKKIMQLRHLQTLVEPTDGVAKVTAMCFCPNGKRLAVCSMDRMVSLFDENGERKDKFSTKPMDKVPTIDSSVSG